VRRLPVLILGISVVGIGAALACGFPSVDFAADNQFVDGSFTPTDGSSSGNGGDGSPPGDGGNSDGNPCKGDPVCDCDGDGDKTPECGGHDCDDRDERVRSTQTDFIDASSNRAGDWNCDNKVEREGDSGVVCRKLLDLSWAADASPQQIEEACAKEGFSEDPGCGEVGNYNRCRKDPRSIDSKACLIDGENSGSRARGCR
jgi:hypothetical protein